MSFSEPMILLCNLPPVESYSKISLHSTLQSLIFDHVDGKTMFSFCLELILSACSSLPLGSEEERFMGIMHDPTYICVISSSLGSPKFNADF